MTPSEIEAEIAALEAKLSARLTNGAATRVRDGDSEVERRHESLTDIRARLAELRAQRTGAPARTRARRVMF